MSARTRNKKNARAAWVLFSQGRGPHPGKQSNEERALARLQEKHKRSKNLSKGQASELRRLKAKLAPAKEAAHG